MTASRVDRPEDDVEEAEVATEPEEVEEEEEEEEEDEEDQTSSSPEAHQGDVTQRIKYLLFLPIKFIVIFID